MRFLVFGAGVLGCNLTRNLFRAGKDVTLLARLGMAVKRGGASLRDRMDKKKKPYIFVGMVCVREAYQGRGHMRAVMDLAFAEGDRLGVPVVLETDAKSKCDKYVHLGMELAGTRDVDRYGTMYDLIRYPARGAEK